MKQTRVTSCTVQVRGSNNVWQTLYTAGNTGGNWASVQVNLQQSAGTEVDIRYHFDTIDNWMNNYDGWYIDDIVIDSGSGDWASIDVSSGPSHPEPVPKP